MKALKYITVFEHEILRHDKGEKRITLEQLMALQDYYGEGIPYYSLCHNGVKFNEYAGVIQIGSTMIEVLPKADKTPGTDAEVYKWRNILIDMLKAVGSFDIKAPSHSNLKTKPNSLLDLYIDLFIQETEYLLHHGLIKQYRKKEANVVALKGRIQFARHMQQNLIHHERFLVCHTVYDIEHKLHFILYKTIRLLERINTDPGLQSRIGNLLLNFPEMPDISITENIFDKIVFNRKILSYKKAIEISRLILLNYHPDLSRGRNYVLALMFDMNKLWEEFILISLRKFKKQNITISAQTSKYFWKPESGLRTRIRPDIVVNKNKENCVVLDTKWKNLGTLGPSSEDLKQMYVYHKFYNANKVALVYPGDVTIISGGKYIDPVTNIEGDLECSIISISVETNIRLWQQKIYDEFENWVKITGN